MDGPSTRRLSSAQRDTDGTVITTHHVGMDLRALHGRPERPGDDEIVDSPSDIALTRIRELTPPGVVPVALLEQAEGVDEARIEEVLKALALLVGEALAAAVGLGIGEIELGVRHIQVAAENDRLAPFELAAVGEEGRIPVAEPQLQAAQVILRIGGIDGDEGESLEFRSDQAPLLRGIALQLIREAKLARERLRETIGELQGLLPGEDRGS